MPLTDSSGRDCLKCFNPLATGQSYGLCPVGHVEITHENTCAKWQAIPEKINTTEAILLADREGVPLSRPTVIKYCREYGLGFQVGGRWLVLTNKLLKFLDGEGSNGN